MIVSPVTNINFVFDAFKDIFATWVFDVKTSSLKFFLITLFLLKVCLGFSK